MNFESKELVDQIAGEVFAGNDIFNDFNDTQEYEGSLRPKYDSINDFASIEDEKLYRIGEASELLGIKDTVLRDWDKKFSKLLKTKRTGGGHRLYSGKDIKIFSKIKEKQDEGYSLSHIQEILKHGETTVPKDVLDTINRKVERLQFKLDNIIHDIEEASDFV